MQITHKNVDEIADRKKNEVAIYLQNQKTIVIRSQSTYDKVVELIKEVRKRRNALEAERTEWTTPLQYLINKVNNRLKEPIENYDTFWRALKLSASEYLMKKSAEDPKVIWSASHPCWYCVAWWWYFYLLPCRPCWYWGSRHRLRISSRQG